MAYVKQKDKWLNELIDFMLKSGTDENIIVGDKTVKCKFWNHFPVCVKDICVDNFVLVDENGELKVYGGDFDDNQTKQVSQENFDKRWRCLNDLDKRFVEYVKYVLIYDGHTSGMNKWIEDNPKKAIKKAEAKQKQTYVKK